jgi:phosphotransferase system HPr-like phosphotransfer protein
MLALGGHMDGDLADASTPKCAKLGAALRGRTVELTATGSRDNNALDKLLRCECKERGVCK